MLLEMKTKLTEHARTVNTRKIAESFMIKKGNKEEER